MTGLSSAFAEAHHAFNDAEEELVGAIRTDADARECADIIRRKRMNAAISAHADVTVNGDGMSAGCAVMILADGALMRWWEYSAWRGSVTTLLDAEGMIFYMLRYARSRRARDEATSILTTPSTELKGVRTVAQATEFVSRFDGTALGLGLIIRSHANVTISGGADESVSGIVLADGMLVEENPRAGETTVSVLNQDEATATVRRYIARIARRRAEAAS